MTLKVLSCYDKIIEHLSSGSIYVSSGLWWWREQVKMTHTGKKCDALLAVIKIKYILNHSWLHFFRPLPLWRALFSLSLCTGLRGILNSSSCPLQTDVGMAQIYRLLTSPLQRHSASEWPQGIGYCWKMKFLNGSWLRHRVLRKTFHWKGSPDSRKIIQPRTSHQKVLWGSKSDSSIVLLKRYFLAPLFLRMRLLLNSVRGTPCKLTVFSLISQEVQEENAWCRTRTGTLLLQIEEHHLALSIYHLTQRIPTWLLALQNNVFLVEAPISYA